MHMARLRCALDLGKSVAASIKARSTQKIVSLSVCIIAAKINILQPAALREPVRQPVALQQIAKRAASRHALVAHRWKNEYFVDREFLGKEPVELYIGEYAAGETKVSRFGAFQKLRDRAQHGAFQRFLDRSGCVLTADTFHDRVDEFFHFRIITKIRGNSPGIVDRKVRCNLVG